jgi:hypothetical protein
VTQRYPDTEAAVKAAAKAALPELAGRVFYAVPKGNPTLPLLTVAHISGGPDDGEAPLDVPRLTFSCWGKNKEDASNLRLALVGWLRSLNSVMLLRRHRHFHHLAARRPARPLRRRCDVQRRLPRLRPSRRRHSRFSAVRPLRLLSTGDVLDPLRSSSTARYCSVGSLLMRSG